MSSKVESSTDPAVCPHPDRLLEELVAKIRKNNNGKHPIAEKAVTHLEILHRVCRDIFEEGGQNFSYRHVSAYCLLRGGPTLDDGTIYKPRHCALIRAWANLAGGSTRANNKAEVEVEASAIDSNRAYMDNRLTPHPDHTLQELIEKTISHRNLSEQAAQNAICRLKILHEVCRGRFKAGSQDFSMRTLGLECAPLGGPTFDNKSIYRSPNRALINAWAQFAGGYTKTPTQLLREQDREETIVYIDTYFQRTGRLPTFEMVRNEGMTEFAGPGRSESAKNLRVTSSMEFWEKAQLRTLPEEVVTACNKLFALTQAIPTASAIRTAVEFQNITFDEITLNEAIERWRQYRFAKELYNFAPTHDKSGFLWLTLHPELAGWRMMVVDYLKTLPSDRTYIHLGLHAFFNEYLLAQSSNLSPHAFLSATHVPPPIADVYMQKVALNEAKKRWRAVYGLFEYVLDHGEGFIVVDSHGHRVRQPQYKNTLPPLAKNADIALSKTGGRKRMTNGSLQDPDLLYLTRLNPQLEQWRVYAIGWLASVKVNLGAAQTAVKELVLDYIAGQRLPSDPSVLLSTEWLRENPLPSYRETALCTTGDKHARPHFVKATEFIDYVLLTHYSAEDDYGRRVISGDFHNFLLDQDDEVRRDGVQNTHSNKDVLPSRYIRYLRDLICPEGAQFFRDLTWAQEAIPTGDWFEVDLEKIDESDPDCVWRTRTVFGQGSRRQVHKSKQVYELWCPGRTIAMMVKLELPLRTYQVRMLDSGEADTWRYEGSVIEKNGRGEANYGPGQFIKNDLPLALNIANIERHAGLFRRMPDSASGKVFAGLYINTNKTQDRGKDQWDRGYVVPWQHGKLLYWCERLRNWQQKYNPIAGPVSCTSLPEKIFGKKSDVQKQQMGSMCFLFRDPVARKSETAWPIANGKLVVLWLKMLERLELICAEKGHTGIDGSRLRFVPDNMKPSDSALYSLHAIRVSLITHLATEGGVEMHILSECIAGHARILMTLYYKKSGVVYVSEAMEAASERLKDETVEQQNWLRWMKDASLKQLEVNSAAVDVSVVQAVKDAFSRGGSLLLRTNLGLCAKGGMSCDSGGRYVDEDTGVASYGPTPGYPQQKNCVRCRWFLTGPAFLPALVHHWNLLHFNLGDSGHRYLETSREIAELESEMLTCQKLNVAFTHQSKLENLRHALTVIYDGNEKLAEDSLATMKLIVRCKHIIDAAAEPDNEVALVAVGGMSEVTINIRECGELEQILTTAIGSVIYVDEDAQKAVLKAGNAFDRMLVMNGNDPIFFKLGERELPVVVAHMTRLLQAYAGGISQAVPFVEGLERLSTLGLFGDTDEIVRLASAGAPVHLASTDHNRTDRSASRHKLIPLRVLQSNDS